MGRVLVVDDQPDAAATLAALILRMGHEARFCTTCDEALEIAREFHPETAFIDLLMPNVNGFECADRLLKRHSPLRSRVVASFDSAR